MPSADTLLKQAERALGAGQVAAAESFALQALQKKLDASHGNALFDLANQLSDRDALKTARAVFQRALQIFPGHSALLTNLGVLHQRSGDDAAAERAFREAMASDGAAVMALANLAHLLFEQGRLAEALPLFDRLVGIAPDAPAEVWNNRGVCQQRARDRGAEASFRRALALAPDSAAVLANLGFLLTAQRRYGEARALLERARALEPARLQVVAQCVELQLQFCDWTDFEQKRDQVCAGLARLPAPGQTVAPFGLLAYCDDPALQLAAAVSFAWPALAPRAVHRRARACGACVSASPQRRSTIIRCRGWSSSSSSGSIAIASRSSPTTSTAATRTRCARASKPRSTPTSCLGAPPPKRPPRASTPTPSTCSST